MRWPEARRVLGEDVITPGGGDESDESETQRSREAGTEDGTGHRDGTDDQIDHRARQGDSGDYAGGENVTPDYTIYTLRELTELPIFGRTHGSATPGA